jgi:hypothetical protein
MSGHADFSLFDEDLTFLVIFNKKSARSLMGIEPILNYEQPHARPSA